MVMRVETIGEAVLYCGDARDVLPTLGRVDAVVTSPPYGSARDYGSVITDWRALVSGVLTQIPDDAAQVLVNLGLIHHDGEVVPYWQGMIDDMRADGWRLFGWYVWDKCDGMGGDWNGRFAPAHEWIFHFNKEPRPVNKVLVSKLAGLIHKGNPGLRRPDGSQSGYSHLGKAVSDYKVPDSVVRIVPERRGSDVTGGHPAVFPPLLPQLLAEAFTDAEGVVVDPFMGSGTTGVACAAIGRKFIGIEIHEPYFDIACRRIDEAYRQPRLFAEPAPKAHQMSMLDGAA